MIALFIFSLKSALVLAVLYLPYTLMLRQESFFRMNRLTLLVILVLALVLPLCDFPSLAIGAASPVVYEVHQQMTQVMHYEAPAPVHSSAAAAPRFSWVALTATLYIIGVAATLIIRLWQLYRIRQIVREGCLWNEKQKDATIYCHIDDVAPFSWMRNIVISENDYRANGCREILLHEKAHILCRHSLDILLLTLVETLQWWNPVVYMLGSSLRDVHEYEADDRVLHQDVSLQNYQALLFKKAVAGTSYAFANNFNHSLIKKRLYMMSHPKSNPWQRSKVLYILPVTMMVITAFATPRLNETVEKVVEKADPALFTGTVDFSGKEPLFTGTLTTGNDVYQLENAQYSRKDADTTAVVGADANLVKADLADQSEEELLAKAVTVYREVNELTDSVMQAVGARRIAEGTYVGHFQPSLNSDTVRIRNVTVLDKQSRVTMGSGISTIDSDDPSAYELTLQQGTRKGETGYYIRYLQPANSTVRNYDKKEIDPNLLSIDSVLTKRSNNNLLYYYFKPIAIERNKKETRIFMYVPFRIRPEDLAMLRANSQNLYKNLAIVDEKTGDKYVCRGTDYDYFKFVKNEVNGKDTIGVYQECLVFPPIDKRVKEAHFGNMDSEEQSNNTFDLNAIPHKGRVITK